DFRIQLALVFFSVALPLDEVFPLASDRTVARAVTVADHEKRVVMEGLCDAVFMQVISQIVVEASPNVQINGLELYENQWQTVHEADKIGPPIVVRHAHALDLQFAHSEEPVIGWLAKVDHLRAHALDLSVIFAPLHRHAEANVVVEVPVALQKRAWQIYAR